MNQHKLAELLVRYSAAVRSGEIVSLIGPAAAEPLLLALYREVLRAGGHPLLLMRPEGCEELRCRHGNAEQIGFVDPFEAREVEVADVAIHVVMVPAWPVADDLDPGRWALAQQW